jgi:predicted  nucleic acid-binding Zn-ribbon protein
LSKADTLLELQQIDLTLERLNKRLAEVKAAQRGASRPSSATSR